MGTRRRSIEWWRRDCLRRGCAVKGLLDGFHQSIGPEWFVENCLKPFLSSFDDRVRRVPPEAGHQDDRYVRLHFPQPFEGFVTIEIGQADVHERCRIGRLPRKRDRFMGVAGCFDACPLASEQMMG